MLEIFGQNAVPLLLSGAFGGLCRGGIAIDVKNLNRSALYETIRAIIVGSFCSLFLHGIVLAMAGGLFDGLHIDPGTEVGLSGFLAGIGGISIIGGAVTFFANRNKPVPPSPPPPPSADPVGGKP